MDLGNKLLELRKKKGLSQEDVAESVGVSRQTVSKWETGMSQPEFERIKPLCDLFDITVEELITGKKIEEKEEVLLQKHKSKSALLLITSIFLYFLSIIAVIIFDELGCPDAIVAGSFLLICAIATCIIVYRSLIFSHDKVTKEKKEIKINPKFKIIEKIITISFLAIYLLLSFLTNAWHITWILWIVFAIVMEIVKLIFIVKGENINEE